MRISLSETQRTSMAAVVATMCFGTSVVATRFVVAQTQPVSLAFLRYVIGTACLAPVLWTVKRKGVPRNDLFAIAALGVMFFGIFPWSFSAALTHSPSSRVAIELATMPLLTLLISRLRGYDRITPPKLMGQLLAFAGLVIALRPAGATAIGSGDVWMGDVLTGITAVCGAAYNVFSRPYLQRYPPLHVTALSMLAGVLFLAPLAAMKGAFAKVPAFTPGGWWALLFLGTLGGAFGFALWSWALQRSTPSRVAVFIAINPLTAITLGVLLLDEPVTLQFLIGFVAVAAGIVLANWRPANPGDIPATHPQR
ncbi:MAG: EamA family transporter [Phycisphaerae bacterium]|nr:EamA family transporter [Gemmatimonadaceae bacterium]